MSIFYDNIISRKNTNSLKAHFMMKKVFNLANCGIRTLDLPNWYFPSLLRHRNGTSFFIKMGHLFLQVGNFQV